MTVTVDRERKADPLRLLLGDDGSASGAMARRLLSGLHWSAGTTLRRAAAVEGFASTPARPVDGRWAARSVGAGVSMTATEVVEDVVRHQMEKTAADFASAGLDSDDVVLHGWAGVALVAAAGRLHPDLVVVGSRSTYPDRPGLGPVSACVVEHLRTAVLIVRRDRIRTILLALNGPDSARSTASFVAALPFSALTTIHAVSVVEPPRTLRDVPYRSAAWAALPGTQERIERERATRQEWLGQARLLLAGGGRQVTSATRVGEPAAEILAAAAGIDADLIAIGRGSGHGSRLGKVTRDVAMNAAGSVLVIPEPS